MTFFEINFSCVCFFSDSIYTFFSICSAFEQKNSINTSIVHQKSRRLLPSNFEWVTFTNYTMPCRTKLSIHLFLDEFWCCKDIETFGACVSFNTSPYVLFCFSFCLCIHVTFLNDGISDSPFIKIFDIKRWQFHFFFRNLNF